MKWASANKGMTLIEMLLSVAIMVILFGLSAVFYRSFQVSNDMDITGNAIAQTLRRAQTLSQTGQEDGSWGVYIEKGGVTLFQGVSYGLRDTDHDELMGIPGSVLISGLQEVVFDKLTGLPKMTGTITLTSVTNETADIIINTKGLVIY